MLTQKVSEITGNFSVKLLLVAVLIELVILLTYAVLPAKLNIFVYGCLVISFFYLLIPNPVAASIVLSVIIAILLPKTYGRPLGIKFEEIFPLLTGFFLLLEYFRGSLKLRPIGKIGQGLLLFLIVAFISFATGLLKGRNSILVVDELLMMLAWGYYLFVVEANLTFSEQKYIVKALIFASFIVSLFYIYKFISLHGLTRFRTDQQHIFNVTIPVLFAVILYYPKNYIKILAALLMIPMILAVYITLTRALWIFIPLSLLGQYLFYIKEQKKFQTLFRGVLPVIIIVALSIIGLLVLNKLLGVQTLLEKRLQTFKFLEYDPSLMARAELGLYIYKRLRTGFLFGSGLGDFLRYRYFPTLGRFNVYWLDNTYLQLLWKTGVIGTILFLLFLFHFFKRVKYLMTLSNTPFIKILGTSLFFSFFALALSSLQCGILIGYRFNFVWATLFALVEICSQECKNRTTNTKGANTV
ncbi:MAG: O-antigen ligase family protein [candidate division WOR-3 bacterium]